MNKVENEQGTLLNCEVGCLDYHNSKRSKIR